MGGGWTTDWMISPNSQIIKYDFGYITKDHLM